MPWRPLVEASEQRARLAQVIRDIDAAVAAMPLHGNEHADLALLRNYAGRDGIVDDAEAASSLARAIGEAGKGGAGLFGGLAGTSWVTAHLAGGDEADGVCTTLDEALVRIVERVPASYDLVSGVAGFGIAALERAHAPSGQKLASSVIDYLDRLAKPIGDGLAWFTSPDDLPEEHRAKSPEGYWNLGVAHGAPGVIAVLARFIAAGVEVERATRLCDGAVASSLGFARARPRDASKDRFPLWHPPANSPSRVAWCYGDLGVACALLAAAVVRQRDDWRAFAIELARDAAKRPVDQGRVVDAGLCHGAAGNAHLFHRLYQATGDDTLRAAATAWLDAVLPLRTDRGVAGFAMLGDHDDWLPAVDLLNGATGIGLALYAAISEVEPAWDRVLVADLPLQA